MSKPDTTNLHSGFARFSDQAARDAFAEAALAPHPELREHALLSETQPTIVFEGLTNAQRDRIRSALSGQGNWFDDVQLHTMMQE